MAKKPLLISALVLVLIASAYMIFRRSSAPSQPPQLSRKAKGGPCPGARETIEMKDALMKGVFEPGQKLELVQNWYSCNPLARGETVYYRFTSTRDPVVRILAAVPGDRFHLVADPAHNAWGVEINGDRYRSGGAPYYFGNGAVKPALSLYEKNGALGDGEVILFSAQPPGGFDSGMFGIASVEDILGKVTAGK